MSNNFFSALFGDRNNTPPTPASNGPRISPKAYQAEIAETDHVLLDVRTKGEVANGVIPGARHIELSELSKKVKRLPKNKTIVVYCNSGNRSRSAVQVLADAGYTELLDLGGIIQWRMARFDVVPLVK